MAHEVLVIDENGHAVAGAVTNNAAAEIRNLKVDPTTGRLLVDAAVTVEGDVGALDQMDLTNANPLTVAVVDSNGDQVTSFGGGTQYTEDAAAAANPVGTAVNLIRADSLAGLTTADGDNVAARGTDKGEMYVKHVDAIPVTQSGTWDEVGINDSGNSLTVDAPVGTPVFVRLSDGSSAIATLPVSLASVPSHAVTNAGTFAVQVDGNALTALQLIDDVVFADDAAFTPGTSKVNAIGFLADQSSPDSIDEGDIGIARMTLDRFQQIVAQIESSAMRIDGVTVTPKFAIIDHATSGDNTLVAAVNPKKIRVLAAFFNVAADVTARFESGAGGTALTGQMQIKAGSGFVLPYSPVGWFETASNTLLNLELSGAVSADGALVYIEV